MTIGTGRDDPRAWVQAAYLLLGTMQDGQTGPRGKLPAGSEIAAKLGVHPMTVALPTGNWPTWASSTWCPDTDTSPRPGACGERWPELGEWLRRQREDRSWARAEMAMRIIKAARDAGDMAGPTSGRVARSISRWEGGAAAPSQRYRLYRCDVLGISPAGSASAQAPRRPTPQPWLSRSPSRRGPMPGARSGDPETPAAW